jgi:hypothetical protein
MVRSLKIFVALLCIVCILALCVAPYADIPVSVLKALQIVIMLMFALMTSLLPLFGPSSRVLLQFMALRADRRAPTRSLLLPLDTNCVQQC